ncbi:MAG: LacI family DNA-binding transcriptional regulator [Clostridia bacterium]|nr:LacI family DNA-binding transcriptional regulator [Clostridia bacterium]
MKKLTVKEIAKMAGVSVTAVSFVLNNKPGVSDETRAKVQQIIDETGFKPNLNSKKLLFNKSFNITLMVNSFSSPFDDLFYFEITRGILNRSRKYNYNITIAKLSSSKPQLPDTVYSGDTDGIIFMQDISEKLVDKAVASKIPSVIVDSHSISKKIPSIAPDYRKATYDATKHLIKCGHTDVAMIASDTVLDFYKQSLLGFCDAMNEADLTANPESCGICARDEESAYDACKKLLSGDTTPSAVVCTVDSFAIGAMRCAKDMGFSVPNDISFIGIDDILLSRYIEPKLTTMGIDKVEMGKMAMDMLFKQIEGETAQSVLLPMELIERDSVKKI